MNILICYMPKTELRMRSYGTMNIAKKLGLGRKSTEFWISDPGRDPGAIYEVRRSCGRRRPDLMLGGSGDEGRRRPEPAVAIAALGGGGRR